jgi:Flp pilus assembly protein TadG
MGLLQRVRNKLPAFGRSAVRLRADKRGNVLVIFGLALPVLLGTLGLAVEGANWYQTKRGLQNAADEAAVAAATNAGSNYDAEARSVTARYGFTNALSNVVVTAKNNDTCPGTGGSCYSVTITKKLPLVFSEIVGFAGNTKIGSSSAVMVTAKAYATRDTEPREYCVLALANSGQGVAFLSNGGPKADLSGCNIMSNTSMTCNGHDLNADYGDAFGTNNGCGNVQTSGVPKVSDPYSYLASNIPNTSSCTSYPQPPKKGTLPASNLLSSNLTGGTKIICGAAQLTTDITLTGTNVLVIKNGNLDLNGHNITTASGAAATIIFTGDNSYSHIPTGGGTINIAAPTSGAWSGVAMFQDPAMTAGTDITDAGNSPSWNITGLVYLPHSSITFSGIVGKATNGKSCFVMVMDTIRINGTGKILDRGQCKEAGLTTPKNNLPVRGRLVG